MTKALSEQIVYKRHKPGQVPFSTSNLSDPYIQKTITVIAQALKVPEAKVIAYIDGKLAEFAETAKLVPTLYGTIAKNVVEDTVFTLFHTKTPPDLVVPGAAKFQERTFFKLIRFVMAENKGKFWPLRSYIDKRTLEPKYSFVSGDGGPYKVKRAAATPSGEFIFNTEFCQKLLDYAEIKDIKPKGKKYECNGGPIPNGYSYIEFLIMHEFMHYTEDDFYFQRIIPNANPKIINWVGDFRSNYTLVKSGYEQIPMGLFNDSINLDRQQQYREMYDLVKAEFDKLPKDEQDQVEGDMDGRADDHEPGQEQGKASEGSPTDPMKDGKPSTEDMTENSRKTEDKIDNREDMTDDERRQADKEAKDSEKAKSDKKGEPGPAGKNQSDSDVDYTKIVPTFNWATLTKKFLSNVSKKTEETYSRVSRRAVGNVEMLDQLGAAPMKPAEIAIQTDAKLGFVFDCSGSMSECIKKVYSNAVNLLRQPAFRNSECYVLKYADQYQMFRVNFARDAGVQIPNLASMKSGKRGSKYNKTANQVFSERITGGTTFSKQMADEIITSLADKWNVLIFVDSDNLWPGNFENFLSVIKAKPNQVFVIFDSRETYLQFRQKAGGATQNITYFD